MMKMSMGWVVLLGAGLLAALSPASAEPVIKEMIAYYDVSGSTPQDLRDELNRMGPFDRDGRQFDAVTRWYVNWRYRYSGAGSDCGIASVTTEAKVNITMPRLKQEATVSPEVRLSFETYLGNLLEHEKGHGKIAIEVALRIEDGIGKLPAEPDCDRMGKVANDLGYSLIREANQQDSDYDAKTNHGETQGARFPK